MTYLKWHAKVIKKISVVSEWKLFWRMVVFGAIVWGADYWYLINQAAKNPINKALADTAIILIGLSMLLSSLCYFWDFVDTKIIYRKHLGLVGFGFGVGHVLWSFSGVLTLLKPETWQNGTYWPLFSGALALIIFTIMAMISNQYAAIKLGGVGWRFILRTGYVAVALIWVHVYLLKSARILTWYGEGMKTTPPTGLILLVFMTGVIVMRIILWTTLLRKKYS